MAAHGFNANVYCDIRVLADLAVLMKQKGMHPARSLSGLIREVLEAVRNTEVRENKRIVLTEDAIEVLKEWGLRTEQLAIRTARAVTLKLQEDEGLYNTVLNCKGKTQADYQEEERKRVEQDTTEEILEQTERFKKAKEQARKELFEPTLAEKAPQERID